MLKPSAKKVSQQAELAAMIEAFKNAGNPIKHQKTDVAKGLKKRKYIKPAFFKTISE